MQFKGTYNLQQVYQLVVGDHEYEYDDDTSDARGEHFCVTVS